LLLFVLKQLVHEQIVYERARHGGGGGDEVGVDTIAVLESDLIDKVG